MRRSSRKIGMRSIHVLVVSCVAFLCCVFAIFEADAGVLDFASYKSDWFDPTRFEFRAGGLVSFEGPERGTGDISLMIVLPKLYIFAPPSLPDVYVPRIQFGGMFNLDSRTSFGHADLLWTINLTRQWFWEPFVGINVHNGQLDGPSPKLSSLGCRALVHAGANVGYRLSPDWSVMFTLDHSSNGNSISGCSTNQSLNLIGVRVGRSM